MKKIITLGCTALLFITVLGLIAAMNVNRLAQKYSALAVQRLQGQTVAGMTIEHLDLSLPQVNIAELAISWSQFDARITMARKHDLLTGKTITLHLSTAQIMMEELFSKTFLVTATGISAAVANPEGTAGQPLLNGFTNLSDGNISLSARISLWPPGSIKPQAKDLLNNLFGLFHTGTTSVPVSFSGVSSFRVGNEIVAANLSVQRVGTVYRLAMDQESLRVISWIMAEKLTDPEVELLSLNPIKAPRLLQIRNDAQESARKAHEDDAIIPEDAYRHVLWSYLLTTAYGDEFAKLVTDAHEQGKTDNTEAEHRMDYRNNAVGRKYAAQHYQRHELVNRLLSDPEIVLEANGNSTR